MAHGPESTPQPRNITKTLHTPDVTEFVKIAKRDDTISRDLVDIQ